MKVNGIVCRIDDLGRIVIPKEFRRNMKIREGDPFEIVSTDQGVLISKYIPADEELESAISGVISILEDEFSQLPDSIKRNSATLMQEIKKFVNSKEKV